MADDVVYAIVLNMWEDKTFKADIKLNSFDGSVAVNGFTAELVAGGKSRKIEGSDTLSVDVEPFQAAVYKITPKDKVDFSNVKASRFRDLANYPWARVAIQDLEQKGIVNAATPISYAPGKNITRGDFAMFLIRTLGLSADTTENFADVKDTAEYAKEVAIGKALGILNGVGDGKFNPESAISRQDMMTICARGMRYASKLGEDGNASDIASFSDAAAVADYAVTSIAAMVKEGIVKGNDDGTINPKGNTTRAEAAVIMERILTK